MFCNSVCAYARGINKMTSNPPRVETLCVWVTSSPTWEYRLCLPSPVLVSNRQTWPAAVPAHPNLLATSSRVEKPFLLLGVDHPFHPSAPAP